MHAAEGSGRAPAVAGRYSMQQRSTSPGESSPEAGRTANGGAASSANAARRSPTLVTRKVCVAVLCAGVAGKPMSSGKSSTPRGPGQVSEPS